MSVYQLDRTAFEMHHTRDSSNNYHYWNSKSMEERLRVANYLNSVAYYFPENDSQKPG